MMRHRLAVRAQRRKRAGQSSSREVPIPLPLRGIYAKARSARVSNLFASELLNLRSNGVSMVTRPGVEWVSAPSAVIQRIPFEFGGASLYITVTPTGATAGALSITRPFGGQASWAAISGNILIADGLGLPVRFDGTAFTSAGFTAAAGPDPAECDGIISHHDRIYLWKTGGPLEFLVGDVGAVTGPMSRFPLGRLGNITGSIQAMTSLTIDAGHGMNDVLCIVTTTGQMILYEGFDPTDPNDWRLVGRVDGAIIIGRRAFTQVGSDAWMLTAQGPISVSQAIRESVLALVSDISQPIADEIAALVEAGPADWQMFTARDGSMVVINRVANGTARQFVYYMEGRSWATMDLPALDWHNLAGTPQITATDGRLGKLRHTGTDELITARWVSSWFEVGRNVSVDYIEPVIISEGPLRVRVVVLSDNNDTDADIAEAQQIIRLTPEEGSGTRLSLSDKIPTDASGKRFQITLEVTARWAEITGLTAALGL
jgi:hypothetical protein